MNKHGYTYSSHQKCELCDELLFIREIFMFPCSHGFHIDCLLHRLRDPVWKYLDDSQISKFSNTIRILKNELCLLCGFCIILRAHTNSDFFSRASYAIHFISNFKVALMNYCNTLVIHNNSK